MTLRIYGAAQEALGRATGRFSHAEGDTTTASGFQTHAEGLQSIASGPSAHAEGNTTTASGTSSHAQNASSVASGAWSHAGGFKGIADGAGAFALGSAGQNGASGVTRMQTGMYSLAATTASTSPTFLTFDGSQTLVVTGQTTNVLVVPPLSIYTFQLMVVGRKTLTAPGSCAYLFGGAVARDSGSNVRIVGTITQLAAWNDGSVGAVAMTADTTRQALSIQVTASTTVVTQWSGTLITNELTLTS